MTSLYSSVEINKIMSILVLAQARLSTSSIININSFLRSILSVHDSQIKRNLSKRLYCKPTFIRSNFILRFTCDKLVHDN